MTIHQKARRAAGENTVIVRLLRVSGAMDFSGMCLPHPITECDSSTIQKPRQ
jgi:hypothetical protein